VDSVQFWLRPVCRWAIYGFASGSRTWLSVQPGARRGAPGNVWLEPESAEMALRQTCGEFGKKCTEGGMRAGAA
jgi:hypothetical protein